MEETILLDLASASDHIDELNDYDDTYTRLHPLYGDQIYGRVFPNPDGTAIVQYWFFYYYQPNFVVFNTRGAHEGDWEGVQVYVDQTGAPLGVAYSQHGEGELCSWSKVTPVGLHPAVFVAHSSHGSYITSGNHPLDGDETDYARGNGDTVLPSVIDITNTPEWMFWPGRWGGTEIIIPGDQESPTGPTQKGDQWQNPVLWQSALSCNE